MIIKTQRLELVLLNHRQLKLWVNEIREFDKQLDCTYQGEPIEGDLAELINAQLLNVEEDNENDLWHSFWMIIRSFDRIVVGTAAFKGEPNEQGEVELGYGLGEAHKHQGYMTEAVRAISAWALEQQNISAVIAETELENLASQRVLQRCGFMEYESEDTKWWRLACVGQEDSIHATKKIFEKCFFTEEDLYDKQTKDENHLVQILNCLHIMDGMKVLDLGTGTGYLAFPVAKQNRGVQVFGLDIVEETLNRNRSRDEKEQICNLQFISYEGSKFPFEDETFDIIITRYALHHFPKIQTTFREIDRVLKKHGFFFVSDPTPNEEDTSRFVDAYMQMKKDGHIKFYSKDEWRVMGEGVGFTIVDSFDTSIRFPKKMSQAIELNDILKLHNPDIVKGYDLEYVGDEVYITEKVNNILFQK